MKWFSVKKNGLPTKNGQYLVTIKSTEDGEVSRLTTVAEFHRRIKLFGADDGNNYSWTWSDDCGENVWAYCCHTWEHEGTVYTEEITAWAYMPEPYAEE